MNAALRLRRDAAPPLPGRYFLDKLWAGLKIKTVKQKRHRTTLREELEDLNDYLDLTEARVRDEGKTRLTHAEVKKRYGLK